jgi:hypothetical protein
VDGKAWVACSSEEWDQVLGFVVWILVLVLVLVLRQANCRASPVTLMHGT